MKLFSTIPRGLLFFLGGIFLIILLALGYKAIAGLTSVPNNSSGPHANFFQSLFPFGNPASPSSPSGSVADQTSGNASENGVVPALRKITSEPVSGGWFIPGLASTSPPSIRYMERGSGHMEETPADSFVQLRISNTTMPGMQELYALSSSTLLVRSLDDAKNIQNFYGIVNATSSLQSFDVSLIRRFDRVAITSSGGLFTVAEVSSGSRAELSKADGTSLQTVFASPLGSWVPLSGGSRLFLETAPSASAVGYVYEIRNIGKEPTLKKIAGGTTGLTALPSPSGRYLAVSGNGANGFVFSVLDTKTGTVWTTPVHAFAMKCSWVPNKEPLIFCAVPDNPAKKSYPDDWFRGDTFFSDGAWILNPPANAAYYIGSLSDDNGPIDSEGISVDQTGSYALFMNKRDLSLWSLYIADTIRRANAQ